jgi:putative ABC transport system ATP-binding protein
MADRDSFELEPLAQDPATTEEEEGGMERVEGFSDEVSINDHDQEDMKIMKRAHHEFNEDKYLSGGNINALVALDEDEREDDAIIISLNNIHKTYLLGVEGVPALRGVSLSVRRGEFLVIFGTSGGGKTSLLNIMGTIDKPTKGNMKICGTRISRSTTDTELSEIRRCKLGFVFQTFNLLSSLTALENVMLPMILAGKYTRAERKARAIQLLNRVGMGSRLSHMPNMLSGGEQQRVTIARAIANQPELLLLDEPTGDLDTVNTLIAMKLLTDLNKKDGITLVMVTHEISMKAYADRVIWMRDGKIQTVERTSAKKKREAYAKLEADFAKLDFNKAAYKGGEEHENDDEDSLIQMDQDDQIDEEVGLLHHQQHNVESPNLRSQTPTSTSTQSNTEESVEAERETQTQNFSSIKFVHTEIRSPTSYHTHPAQVRAGYDDQRSRGNGNKRPLKQNPKNTLPTTTTSGSSGSSSGRSSPVSSIDKSMNAGGAKATAKATAKAKGKERTTTITTITTAHTLIDDDDDDNVAPLVDVGTGVGGTNAGVNEPPSPEELALLRKAQADPASAAASTLL